MTEAFAIKGPDGNLIHQSIKRTEIQAWDSFRGPYSLLYWSDLGYRCVPVQVTEGWISVSERLPERNQINVLCYSVSGLQHVMSGFELNNQLDFAKSACLWSHWMPLPPPPKDQS